MVSLVYELTEMAPYVIHSKNMADFALNVYRNDIMQTLKVTLSRSEYTITSSIDNTVYTYPYNVGAIRSDKYFQSISTVEWLLLIVAIGQNLVRHRRHYAPRYKRILLTRPDFKPTINHLTAEIIASILTAYKTHVFHHAIVPGIFHIDEKYTLYLKRTSMLFGVNEVQYTDACTVFDASTFDVTGRSLRTPDIFVGQIVHTVVGTRSTSHWWQKRANGKRWEI